MAPAASSSTATPGPRNPVRHEPGEPTPSLPPTLSAHAAVTRVRDSVTELDAHAPGTTASGLALTSDAVVWRCVAWPAESRAAGALHRLVAIAHLQFGENVAE